MKKGVPRSFRKKISICFIVFSLTVLVGMIAIVDIMYQDFTRDKLQERIQYEDKLVSQQVSLVQTHANRCANTVVLNINTMLNRGEIPSNEFDDPNQNTAIAGVLENAVALYPMVHSVCIVYETGALYGKEKKGLSITSAVDEALLHELAQASYDTKGRWVRDLEIPSVTLESPLYYVKVFRDIYSNKDVGYVMILLDEQEMYQSYANTTDSNQATDIYILDGEGFLISSSDRALVKQEIGNLDLLHYQAVTDQIENTEEYSTYVTELDNGWQVMSVVDISQAVMGFEEIVYRILVFGVLMLLLFTVVMLYAVGKITQPMHTIAQYLRNFNIVKPKHLPPLPTGDEIGTIVDSFNVMVDKNTELFDKVEQDRIQQRHLELALLQNQIKPHFLYNTLDTIYCLSSMGDTAASAHVTKALAEYYRNVLNKGSEWITIKNEIMALERYLEIQTVRYNNILRYEITCDAEVESCMIPKMTLQPIVENAIYHGIKPKKTVGTIRIHAYQEDEQVRITVSDDGIGLTEQLFQQKIAENKDEQITDSFGMKNVHERLKLFFDNNSGLQWQPSAVGTTIVVCIGSRQ